MWFPKVLCLTDFGVSENIISNWSRSQHRTCKESTWIGCLASHNTYFSTGTFLGSSFSTWLSIFTSFLCTHNFFFWDPYFSQLLLKLFSGLNNFWKCKIGNSRETDLPVYIHIHKKFNHLTHMFMEKWTKKAAKNETIQNSYLASQLSILGKNGFCWKSRALCSLRHSLYAL